MSEQGDERVRAQFEELAKAAKLAGYDEAGPVPPAVWNMTPALVREPMFHVEHSPPLHRSVKAIEEQIPQSVPQPTVAWDGRWSWPDLFHYEIEGPPEMPEAFTVSAYPPSEREALEITLRRPEARRDVSPAARAPRTPPYRIKITGDKETYLRLVRTNMLNDPRHTGVGYEPMVDNPEGARRMSDWQAILGALANEGPSRDIDTWIHRDLGYAITNRRVVPNYGISFDACQRVLLQKGWRYSLAVGNGMAQVMIQGDTLGRVIAHDGPVSDIGRLVCTAMLHALDLEAKRA